MTFAKKLKNIRKQAGMSQEKLAEKLGVSRQAVTKWETDGGIPDIENIMAISKLFQISIDELLTEGEYDGGRNTRAQTDYLFESVTEYDIDCMKRYDMKLGGASLIVLSGYEGEKIRVRLASNTLSNIQSDLKLKIDDVRNCIDLDMNRFNNITEAAAKEALSVFIQLPQKYVTKVELEAHAGTIEFHTLTCENIELDGKVTNVLIDEIEGTVELNCNLDMNIVCKTLKGAVEINQLSATSRICVPEEVSFAAVKKGIANTICYEKNGMKAEPFDDAEAENIIELNGVKSELVIYIQVC